jgi:hypothetical protein
MQRDITTTGTHRRHLAVRVATGFLTLAAGTALLAACGDDATEPLAAPPTVPVAEAGPPVELEDGRHFGYLVGFELDSHATAASFDLAQLFTGDAADEAAAQDGVIAPGEQIENDVYIRNVSTRLRRALFRDDATITVVRCDAGCSSVPADRATLQNRPTPVPVLLTVTGGVVVAAEEVYLP